MAEVTTRVSAFGNWNKSKCFGEVDNWLYAIVMDIGTVWRVSFTFWEIRILRCEIWCQ
jgi:hypothetical protein